MSSPRKRARGRRAQALPLIVSMFAFSYGEMRTSMWTSRFSWRFRGRATQANCVKVGQPSHLGEEGLPNGFLLPGTGVKAEHEVFPAQVRSLQDLRPALNPWRRPL